MIRIAISPAGSALLRALIARAEVSRNRILLTDVQSADWQSLTLAGERHLIELRVAGPGASAVVDRLCSGLEDAEFSIPNMIVADIAVLGVPQTDADGSISVAIEALTIAED
jgi:hypothetical protein